MTAFIVGFTISFLGTIPIGVVNMTAFQIAVNNLFSKVFEFVLGVLIIEYVQVALTLVFVEWISSNAMLNTIFKLLAIIVFLAMGLHYLTSRPNLDTKAETNQKFFKKGLVSSALNPMAFPFWVFNISLFYSSAEYTFIQDHFFNWSNIRHVHRLGVVWIIRKDT